VERLFIAIDLPDSVAESLAAIRQKIDGFRWVRREQLHLTLRFIGAVDDTVARNVVSALERIRGTPFSLSLSGLGHFPPGRAPRVFWAGVVTSPPLLLLQYKIESAVQGVGLPGEARRFTPHVTIARLRDVPLRAITEIERHNNGFSSPPFLTSCFHLYRSSFTQSAVFHEIIATYPLNEVADLHSDRFSG
jgi:2'-5' RNA ligase